MIESSKNIRLLRGENYSHYIFCCKKKHINEHFLTVDANTRKGVVMYSSKLERCRL